MWVLVSAGKVGKSPQRADWSLLKFGAVTQFALRESVGKFNNTVNVRSTGQEPSTNEMSSSAMSPW